MSMHDYLFTSESVTEGHPDKVADQISDAILDNILGQDKHGRVACETLVTTGMAVIAGEITTSCYVDIPAVVRETIKGIGYNDSSMGFDWETCAVLTSIDKQSPDISVGVTAGEGLFKEQVVPVKRTQLSSASSTRCSCMAIKSWSSRHMNGKSTLSSTKSTRLSRLPRPSEPVYPGS